MMYDAEYPDEVSGLLLVEGLMPFEHELDVSVSTPAELKALKKELDNNAERLWRYDADAKADPRLAERLPDVPVTYMFGTRQTLPAEWPSGAYLAKLKAIIGSLDDGRLVDVAAGHGIPVEAPDEVTAQLQRFL
jgi:pimeloyl-ACP methyl ester carboxylesterase